MGMGREAERVWPLPLPLPLPSPLSCCSHTAQSMPLQASAQALEELLTCCTPPASGLQDCGPI